MTVGVSFGHAFGHERGNVMDVISELDTLCIVARELYGERGAVLASEPIEKVRWFLVVEQEQHIGPGLALEAAEIAWSEGVED